jgi:hypothetical protein
VCISRIGHDVLLCLAIYDRRSRLKSP